ncbi:iron-containing redox enzyme family protein [Streptosporangium algeriense]|uniref:Iron-containing redox enzyme family protein n=1 Tax=Streptosporangium algeriense TaxID=1682748 RepID=A0ABW3DWC5_9ACTN
MMRLPAPRGPVTAFLFERLTRPPHAFDPPPAGTDDAAGPGEDLQLALFTCYELHYQGFEGVDDAWEWEPSLLALRRTLERRFEEWLARAVPPPVAGESTGKPGGRLNGEPARESAGKPGGGSAVEPERVCRVLTELVAEAEGPPLAAFLERRADPEQFREFVVHRSIYHLKEADPHTWALPRLRGRAKAALAEIQADEYGGGRRERMHSELFRATMRGLDLDDSYGAYLDRVPAITLATVNLMSLFGLHRARRGALLGHLAVFEMTSSLPNLRYGRGLRRLGGDVTACRFYDEHVLADAVHEQIAAHDMCGGFAAAEPALTGDILYGAACALALDRLFAEHVLDRWTRGATSLREESLVVGGP